MHGAREVCVCVMRGYTVVDFECSQFRPLWSLAVAVCPQNKVVPSQLSSGNQITRQALSNVCSSSSIARLTSVPSILSSKAQQANTSRVPNPGARLDTSAQPTRLPPTILAHHRGPVRRRAGSWMVIAGWYEEVAIGEPLQVIRVLVARLVCWELLGVSRTARYAIA